MRLMAVMWGFYNFNHLEPKAPAAKVKEKEECAYCHIAGAKKDEVWTRFYVLLDKRCHKPGNPRQAHIVSFRRIWLWRAGLLALAVANGISAHIYAG
jgi:hypothetical protein